MLNNYFNLQKVSDSTTEGSKILLPTRIAVIGPTTHGFLLEQLRLRVDAIAEKPIPEHLVSAVEKFDRKNL
jgi:uroporphyrinogen-III synthase